MKAEISVQDGKPVIRLYDISAAERGLLEHFRPFFPAEPAPRAGDLSVLNQFGVDWKIVGDRLPGTPHVGDDTPVGAVSYGTGTEEGAQA